MHVVHNDSLDTTCFDSILIEHNLSYPTRCYVQNLLGTWCEMQKIQLGKDLFAMVDDEDYQRLSQYRWYARRNMRNGCFYAVANIAGHAWPMHAVVIKRMPGFDIDHKNRDTLDNRKENLRHATRSQNSANAIGKKRKITNAPKYKGVTKCTHARTFMARIVVRMRTIHLGNYRDEESAARAYDAAAIKYFGEFALTNF